MSGAEFHETGTLIAALGGDEDTVRARIDDMLPFERRELARACNLISSDIGLHCDGCGKRIDSRGPFAALVRGTWHPECARPKVTKPVGPR